MKHSKISCQTLLALEKYMLYWFHVSFLFLTDFLRKYLPLPLVICLNFVWKASGEGRFGADCLENLFPLVIDTIQAYSMQVWCKSVHVWRLRLTKGFLGEGVKLNSGKFWEIILWVIIVTKVSLMWLSSSLLAVIILISFTLISVLWERQKNEVIHYMNSHFLSTCNPARHHG